MQKQWHDFSVLCPPVMHTDRTCDRRAGLCTQERLQPLNYAPSLLMIGADDEFVPPTVNRNLLAMRMQNAAGTRAKALVVPKGNHKLEREEKAAVQYIADFLKTL